MNEQEQELRQVNKFINDLWLQLIKKHYTSKPDPATQNWHDIINDAEALGLKYDARARSLPANLINAFLDYLDGKEYEMRKGRDVQ